jgi:hypothetical protein
VRNIVVERLDSPNGGIDIAVDTSAPRDKFITSLSESPFTSYWGLWNITGAFTVDKVIGSFADVIKMFPSTFAIVPVERAGSAPTVKVETIGLVMTGI